MSCALQGHPRRMGHSENSVKIWSTVEGNRKTTPVFLLQEHHEQYKKTKRYEIGRWVPQIRRCPMWYQWKVEGSLQMASERMKWLCQSRNDAQLWISLAVKVKSDAVKNNIALKPGMLGPWTTLNWMWSSRRWKSKHQHLRNQWTKMDRNRQISLRWPLYLLLCKNPLEEMK